jgi:hypothetical protein
MIIVKMSLCVSVCISCMEVVALIRCVFMSCCKNE